MGEMFDAMAGRALDYPGSGLAPDHYEALAREEPPEWIEGRADAALGRLAGHPGWTLDDALSWVCGVGQDRPLGRRVADCVADRLGGPAYAALPGALPASGSDWRDGAAYA